VEGMNIAGLLLGFVAALVLGGTCLVAIGHWIARRSDQGLRLFAIGLLSTAVVAAFAVLSFLAREINDPPPTVICLLTALSLVVGGSGQFVANRQGRGAYGAALVCTLGSIGFVVAAFMVTEYGQYVLNARNLCLSGLSLVLAAASMIIGLFWRSRGQMNA